MIIKEICVRNEEQKILNLGESAKLGFNHVLSFRELHLLATPLYNIHIWIYRRSQKIAELYLCPKKLLIGYIRQSMISTKINICYLTRRLISMPTSN